MLGLLCGRRHSGGKHSQEARSRDEERWLSGRGSDGDLPRRLLPPAHGGPGERPAPPGAAGGRLTLRVLQPVDVRAASGGSVRSPSTWTLRWRRRGDRGRRLGRPVGVGPHRLLCGDAADTGDVSRLVGQRRADLAFTDPPYNVSLGDHGGQGRGQRKRRCVTTPCRRSSGRPSAAPGRSTCSTTRTARSTSA